MEQKTMPQNIQELKQMILEVVNEINNSVPEVSDEEQEEIEKLHGKALEEAYNPEDYVRI